MNVINKSRAQEIMGARLQSALSRTQSVIEQVETTSIDDKLVAGQAFHWEVGVQAPNPNLLEVILEQQNQPKTEVGVPISVRIGDEVLSIHDNALSQFSAKTGLPMKFASQLRSSGEWGQELLQRNLNELAHKELAGKRLLVRSVNNQVRGILSDRYRRIDSKPVLNAIIGELQEVGAVPCDAIITDTNVAVRAVLPELFEPIEGEFMLFGFSWSNSDFGRGMNRGQIYTERIACLNGATMTSLLKEVHLGRQISEDFAFSDETYRLDTLTSISKSRDVVRHAFNRELIDRTFDAIRLANEEKISPKHALAKLEALSKEEKTQVIDIYNGADVVNLPAGNTAYRLSNAVSWFANQKELVRNEDRKLELQELAGHLLGAVKIA